MSRFSKGFCQSLARCTRYNEESKVLCWTIGNKSLILDEFVDTLSFSTAFNLCLPYFSVHYLRKHKILGRFDPQLLKDCTYFIKYYDFRPIHMIDVDMKNLTPRSVQLYNMPKMLNDVPLYILKTDGIRAQIDPTCESGFNYCYGSVFDRPRSVVTGVFDTGYVANLEKMAMNKMYPDPVITQGLIFSAIVSLLHEVGHREEDRLEFFMPDYSKLKNLIEQYQTSPGESPFKNVTVYNIDTGETKVRVDPPTKRSIAEETCRFIMKFLEEVEQASLDGKMYNKVFPGESTCRESRKNEILNALECMDYQELCDMHTKVRLFYIESSHFTIVSHVYLKGVFAFLKGFGFEIGASLNEGEFLDIWDYHECKTDEHLKIYDEYPELREREYGEGDIKRFDQSLIYSLLFAVGIFFACFYRYSQNAMRTVMSDIIFRLCTKFLYLVGLDAVKMVLGMMFSGKFETSHGNTAYQNIVFRMYKTYKLMKYKDHPKFYLLEISIKFVLVTNSFCGDDMFLGWPRILRELFNFCLMDYKEFCANVGLYFKFCRNKPLYAIVKFEEDGIKKEIYREEGIVFLKNQMAKIFEGDKFVGIYPYRPFKDLVFRIGNSDKANEYLDTFYAKILSLAYLSVGNSEFYMYLSTLEKLFRKKNTNYKFEKDICINLFKGSYTMHNFQKHLGEIDEKDPFPTLKFLRNKHDSGIKRNRVRLMNFNQYYDGTNQTSYDVFG
jgi:hypothetical protein